MRRLLLPNHSLQFYQERQRITVQDTLCERAKRARVDIDVEVDVDVDVDTDVDIDIDVDEHTPPLPLAQLHYPP